MFDNFKQTAITIVGTIILTATAVGAAVGPARAVETAPVYYAQLPASSALNAGGQANG
jgi:hypothetical protein